MIEEDIRLAIIGNVGIAAIVSTRVFIDNPLNEQSGPYIVFAKVDRRRDMVSDHSRFKFFVYDSNKTQLLSLVELIVALFEGVKRLNNQNYYSVSLLNNFNGQEMLKNGMYWSVLEYEFKKTT